MRRSTLRAFPLAVLTTCAIATGVSAQVSTTRGFTVGLHASAASLIVENQDRNNAGGGGILVGVGVNRRVTIFLQADGAEFEEQSTGEIQGTWTMAHADLGVRYHFANSLRRWVPFLQAAIGGRAISVKDPMVNSAPRDKVSIAGGGFTLGGGLDVYFSRSLALDVQLLWTGGEFTTVTVDNVSTTGFNFKANSSRFNIGVSWWP